MRLRLVLVVLSLAGLVGCAGADRPLDQFVGDLGYTAVPAARNDWWPGVVFEEIDGRLVVAEGAENALFPIDVLPRISSRLRTDTITLAVGSRDSVGVRVPISGQVFSFSAVASGEADQFFFVEATDLESRYIPLNSMRDHIRSWGDGERERIPLDRELYVVVDSLAAKKLVYNFSRRRSKAEAAQVSAAVADQVFELGGGAFGTDSLLREGRLGSEEPLVIGYKAVALRRLGVLSGSDSRIEIRELPPDESMRLTVNLSKVPQREAVVSD